MKEQIYGKFTKGPLTYPKDFKIPPIKYKYILKFDREIKAIRLRLTLAIIEDILRG